MQSHAHSSSADIQSFACSFRRRGTLLAALLLAGLLIGCGGDDDADSESCSRAARAFDEDDLDDGTACIGDTVMLRLDPEGDGMVESVRLRVPEAGRVRFCIDLGDEHPHELALHHGDGGPLARARQGDGCVEADLPAGLHTLRFSNGRAANPTGAGYFAFFRPAGVSVEVPDATTAGTSPLLGTYTLSSDCPGCDLRGVDLSGAWMSCFDMDTGECGASDPRNAKCLVWNTQWVYNYNLANDLRGARFGGANFLGSAFWCVDFSDAEFWDATFGAARLGVGPSCCTEGFPPRPTIFEASLFSGASFRNVDLRAADFSCSIPGETGTRFYDPALLPGVDLRGANLAGKDLSTKSCLSDDDPSNPYQRLDLSGAILDATTNLQNTDLGSADLSGWDWHAADWSTATFQYAVLAGGNMSGIDFTASKYAGKFFIADKQADRFAHADFSGVDFTNAKLAGLDLASVHMPSANFTGANLHGANVANAYFHRANFTGADLGSIVATEASPVTFDGATMIRTFLKSASLPGSFFRGAVLAPANLGSANLSGAYFEVDLACLDPQGNCLASQPGCVCQSATLSGSYMHNTVLAGARMSDTVLDFVSWYNDNPAAPVATGAGAFLNGASFNLADLPGLDLTGAFLQGVTMTNAQLVGVNLTGASLGRDGTVRSNLSVANLRGANLTNADLTYANLQNAGVSSEPEQEVFIEVLKDPDHYQAAQVYQYFAVNRPATNLGSASGASVATDFATCPNSTTGPCGPITSPAWIAPSGPQEPTDCTPSEFDEEGNVIAITCSSSRHPTGG